MNDRDVKTADHRPLPQIGHMPPRVLIAGGGVAALETLLALRSLAEERVAIELLAPEREFVYRPLAVAEIFDLGETHRFDVGRIAGDRNARQRREGLAAVQPDRHIAQTTGGGEIQYDALVVASGARVKAALPGAVTFTGQSDIGAVRQILEEAESGAAKRIAFAAPGGVAWVLPLYELALMTANRLDQRGVKGVELMLVTPEDSPLVMFGARASDAVAALLEERGIGVHAGRHPAAVEDGELLLVPGERMEVDRVIALPALEGPRLPGLPHDSEGFIATDRHCRVEGLEDVYAAGDITSFPVKQGGLAAQQADVVAESIAARAGAEVTPKPFRPVLRGMLLTGGRPSYLRAEIGGGRGESAVADHALWWPPSKIAGRHLASYLAARPGLVVETPPDTAGLSVELDLT